MFRIHMPDNTALLLTTLHHAGYEAYLVGGCVRDSLLGKPPKDWDICTNATPKQTKQVFYKYRTIDTGIRHGTVTVVLGSESYEITTYRTDGPYSDGRHPDSVCFTPSLHEDLKRRDITINAMAYNEENGLVDYFHGQEDLNRKVLRCVGNPDERFQEDALRILRILRFAANYRFHIEENTDKSIRKNKERLNVISAERINQEFTRMLCGQYAANIIDKYSDVIAVFIPEIIPCIGFQQDTPHHVYDVYHHAALCVSEVKGGEGMRLAAFFHDIGKPCTAIYDAENNVRFPNHSVIGAEMTEAIMSRLRYDTKTIHTVTKLIQYHDYPTPETKQDMRKLVGLMGSIDQVRMLFDFKRGDIAAQNPIIMYERHQKINRATQWLSAVASEKACFSMKHLMLDGSDIKQMGIKEGALIGVILRDCLEQVMYDKIPNIEEDLKKYIKERYL